jgi:hypothetical protein
LKFLPAAKSRSGQAVIFAEDLASGHNSCDAHSTIHAMVGLIINDSLSCVTPLAIGYRQPANRAVAGKTKNLTKRTE